MSSKTHSDPVVFVVNSHFVFLPVDGGFGMASGWDTLQDRWLSGCHHHICRVLSEVISQHCGGKKKKEETVQEECSM